MIEIITESMTELLAFWVGVYIILVLEFIWGPYSKPPKGTDMLKFKKRCRKKTTSVADHKVWDTFCDSYRVVESVLLFGTRRREWRAEIHRVGGWDVLSRHKSKDAAAAACQRRDARDMVDSQAVT